MSVVRVIVCLQKFNQTVAKVDGTYSQTVTNVYMCYRGILFSINVVFVCIEIPSTANQSSAVFSSSYIPQAQLYYYTQLLGCTTLLQSMQINSYLNGGNLWLPPYLWPNLSALNSPTGTNMPVNLSVEALNEASIHQATLVCTPPVKCSVVKTIGSIDSDRTSHHESLNQNSAAFFCRQLC